MLVGGYEINDELIFNYLQVIKEIDYGKGDYLLLDKQREEIHDEILYQLKLVRGINLDEIDRIDEGISELYTKMCYPDEVIE